MEEDMETEYAAYETLQGVVVEEDGDEEEDRLTYLFKVSVSLENDHFVT